MDDGLQPNGLAFSGRLECITLTDQNDVVRRLDAKITLIQPLRCNTLLARNVNRLNCMKKTSYY